MTTNTPGDEARPTTDEETRPTTDKETDDIGHDLPDGAGCIEIWEHLSERRDADTTSGTE